MTNEDKILGTTEEEDKILGVTEENEEDLGDRTDHFNTASVTEEEYFANKIQILKNMGYTEEEIAEM